MNDLKRIDLGDGIALNYFYTDKFKTDYLSVNYILPLDAYAVAHAVILSRVLIRGSAAYPTNRELAKRCEELYSADIVHSTYKIGEFINLAFSLESLAGRFTFDSPELFSDCVGLLGEILENPLISDGSFDSEYVELEKKNQLIAIASKKNNKSRYAVNRCVEIMCKDESFGIPSSGREEDIARVTADSLYSFYCHLMSKSSIELFYFGAESADFVVECVRERLAPRCERKVEFDFRPMLSGVSKKTPYHFSESARTVQGKLVMGYRTGVSVCSENYAAFSVFCNVLFDSPISKLFVNVREKLGLCYYCGGITESSVGLLLISSGIKNENKNVAQTEIIAQISAISDRNITAEELAAAKRAIIASYVGMYDNPSSVESWYLFRRVNSAETIAPEELVGLIERVEVDDVANIAKGLSLDTVYFLEGLSAEDGDESIDAEGEV